MRNRVRRKLAIQEHFIIEYKILLQYILLNHLLLLIHLRPVLFFNVPATHSVAGGKRKHYQAEINYVNLTAAAHFDLLEQTCGHSHSLSFLSAIHSCCCCCCYYCWNAIDHPLIYRVVDWVVIGRGKRPRKERKISLN